MQLNPTSFVTPRDERQIVSPAVPPDNIFGEYLDFDKATTQAPATGIFTCKPKKLEKE